MNGVMVNRPQWNADHWLRFGHCRHLALMSNRWNYLIKQVGQGMYMVNACLVLYLVVFCSFLQPYRIPIHTPLSDCLNVMAD